MFSEAEKEFLTSEHLYRLATVTRDGWPHSVPIGYCFDGEFFFLLTDPAGEKKLDNIKANEKVCLIVDPVKPRRAVMVQGRAMLVEQGEPFRRIMEFVKWIGPRQVVIRVEPVKKVSWGIKPLQS